MLLDKDAVPVEDTPSMLETWLRRYGALTALITGVVIVTVFMVKLEQNSSTSTKELVKLNHKVEEMNGILTLYVTDREKYERWNRQENARLKRVFNRLGWEYEAIE